MLPTSGQWWFCIIKFKYLGKALGAHAIDVIVAEIERLKRRGLGNIVRDLFGH